MPSKLRGIVENTTRKTMFNQTIRRMLHKYDFHGRKVQQQKERRLVSRTNHEDRV